MLAAAAAAATAAGLRCALIQEDLPADPELTALAIEMVENWVRADQIPVYWMESQSVCQLWFGKNR